MILRLSQELAKKVKVSQLDELPVDENPFVDWSTHLFTVGRRQYVMLSNTKSLYSCVMMGKGINNESAFIERSVMSIREFLRVDRLDGVFEQYISPNVMPVRFAKALNRSVTGSMNELILAAQDAIEFGQMPLLDVGLDINDYLLSAIAEDPRDGYGKPRDAFLRMSRNETG